MALARFGRQNGYDLIGEVGAVVSTDKNVEIENITKRVIQLLEDDE